MSGGIEPGISIFKVITRSAPFRKREQNPVDRDTQVCSHPLMVGELGAPGPAHGTAPTPLLPLWAAAETGDVIDSTTRPVLGSNPDMCSLSITDRDAPDARPGSVS